MLIVIGVVWTPLPLVVTACTVILYDDDGSTGSITYSVLLICVTVTVGRGTFRSNGVDSKL